MPDASRSRHRDMYDFGCPGAGGGAGCGRGVVLYFYPRDDTPGCTVEACGFRDALPDVSAAGAVVLGVSRDDTASHVRFKEKFGLNFPLLSDPDAAVHRAYGAWGEKVLYGKKSIGVIRSTVL